MDRLSEIRATGEPVHGDESAERMSARADVLEMVKTAEDLVAVLKVLVEESPWVAKVLREAFEQ